MADDTVAQIGPREPVTGAEGRTTIGELLVQAAHMRVAGRTWEEVAQAVNRAYDTVTHWPAQHPKEWSQCMVDALNDALADRENESMLVSQKNLHASDRALAQTAARDIMRHCRELRGRLVKLEHSGPGGGPIHLSTSELIMAAQNGGFRSPQSAEASEDADGESSEDVEDVIN